MIRGTTPRIIFKINNLEDFSEIKDVWISIKNKKIDVKSIITEEEYASIVGNEYEE